MPQTPLIDQAALLAEAVHTAACAVLDYTNSWGYADAAGQQQQRRRLAGWKAGEAVDGGLDLADAAERLAELVSLGTHASCAVASAQAACAAFEAAISYASPSANSAVAAGQLAAHWSRGFVAQPEDLSAMAERLADLCMDRCAAAAARAVRSYEDSMALAEAPARRLAAHWRKGFVAQPEDLGAFAERLAEVSAKNVSGRRAAPIWRSAHVPQAHTLADMAERLNELTTSKAGRIAACTYNSAMDYATETQAARRLAPYWAKSYVAQPVDRNEMAERLAELMGKPAATARRAGATYADAMGYSESQATVRRLAPYWSKGHMAQPVGRSEMAERLAELGAKGASAARAAGNTYCDSMGYSEQAIGTQHTAPIWRSSYVPPQHTLEDMAERLAELAAKPAASARAAGVLYEDAMGYSRTEASSRLAPYWRKGYVAPKLELSDMAERLAELAGKPAVAARRAGATYEDAMDYSESQAPARRLAPYWRNGYVAPKMELTDMSERLAEMTSKARRLPAYWRKGFIASVEDLAEMARRLEELSAKKAAATATSAANDYNDSWGYSVPQKASAPAPTASWQHLVSLTDFSNAVNSHVAQLMAAAA